MLVIKIPLGKTQAVKEYLQKNKLIDNNYEFVKDNGFFYMPIKKSSLKSKFPFIEIVDMQLKKKTKITTLRQALSSKLTTEEKKNLKTAHDVVGNIAILEIDETLAKKAKIIAEELLKLNKNIKTVLKKSGIHEGEFRTQKLSYLAGIRTKETVHKENHILIKLDVEKVYFSARSATERKRIMGLVKDNEEILVMFSGSGVYPVVLSKNTSAKEIIGIEKNDIAHKYALENKQFNHCKNIIFIQGDVRQEAPKLNKKFDRILMPLPKSAETFLDTAFLCAKKGTIIHLYQFLAEEEFDDAINKVKSICRANSKKCQILCMHKCGQFSPKIFRVCIDFTIL